MTIRVAPPANAQKGVNPITVNAGSGQPGRTYSAAVGSTLDVPDHDAFQLIRNGWHQCGSQVATTANRPTAGIAKDTYMIDSTLGKAIMYDGTQWRDPVTGAVV